MAAEKLTGYVLASAPLTASRLIVSLFTRTGGKRKGVLRLDKRQTRAFLTPMARLSFQLTGKEHQELKTLGQANLEFHRYDLAADYLGLCLLQHWAHLVDLSQPEHHEDDRVYRLLTHCLESLDANPEPAILTAKNLFFEAWLLHFCGMLPRNGGAPEPDEGEPPPTARESRLWRALDPSLTAKLFRRTIHDFAADAPAANRLSPAVETLGALWEHFLAKPVKTRTVLLACLRERASKKRPG